MRIVYILHISSVVMVGVEALVTAEIRTTVWLLVCRDTAWQVPPWCVSGELVPAHSDSPPPRDAVPLWELQLVCGAPPTFLVGSY